MLKWLRGAGNARERKLRRVAVIDATTVDRRRRLVLIRRDNIEHLLMIGGPTDVVIEPNIMRVGAREPTLHAAPQPARLAAESFNRLTPSEVPPPFRPGAPRVSTPTLPAKTFDNLEELTRQLETALHRSPAPQIHPPVTDPLAVPPPPSPTVSARPVAQPDQPVLERGNPRLQAKAEPMSDPKKPEVKSKLEPHAEPKPEPKLEPLPEPQSEGEPTEPSRRKDASR